MIRQNIYKFDYFKTYYFEGAEFVGKYQMPQLHGTQSIPQNIVSFAERNSVRQPEQHWIDHFIDDYRFGSVYPRLLSYLPMYSRFQGIIGTDYSMLPELPMAENIWNCARNRIIDYCLESTGNDVIPAVGWMDEDSFEWCFDGLPERSSLAISTNGCKNEPLSRHIFFRGIEELFRRLNPTHLIICGKALDELPASDKILYYPPHGLYAEVK